MPSIEIVCIGQHDPIAFDHHSFAVESGRELVSHRGPDSLFQSDLNTLTGCIYHLGNPDLKESAQGRYFFAYELLSVDSREPHPPPFLEFHSDHQPDVESLLAELLEESPEGRLLFTSDWQFGPEHVLRHVPLSLHEFWDLHDRRGLDINAAYPLTRAA